MELRADPAPSAQLRDLQSSRDGRDPRLSDEQKREVIASLKQLLERASDE